MTSTQVKKARSSKTLWINGLALAATVATFIVDANLFAEHPAVIAALIAASNVANIVLRFATKTGIGK